MIEDQVKLITGATAFARKQTVQTLWSGYGEIKRFFLEGGKYPSVIVKHIQWPEESNHPKGWNTEISHQRKLKSYQVEKYWYQHFSKKTNQQCKVPEVLQIADQDGETILIMEDLDALGFDIRLQPETVTIRDAKNCLTWLAVFHATFMGTEPEGLWPTGTYWHLDTRPDEWEKMQNIALKQAAKDIDLRLTNARFQTFVHGDAKLANFCFGQSDKVAAVDFQYVGKGCGIKDVAYFISSCFDGMECEKYEEELLNHYFIQLEISLDKSIDFQGIKKEWTFLYPYAWADLYRFLNGWSPGHWKMHGYSKKMTERVLNELNNEES